jgi:hypothetical protein
MGVLLQNHIGLKGLMCTLVPRGEFGFGNCMEYFIGLGPKKFGPKMVLRRR